MRKSIIYVFSMIFLMGFCGAVSAAVVTDSTTDSLIAAYDIGGVNVEAWTVPTPTPPLPPLPDSGKDYIKLTVDMASGKKTPGIVTLELDADGDTATGGHVSMTGIFPPCAGGPKMKIQAGYDILITVILRKQHTASSTSLCAGCAETPGCTVDCSNTRLEGEWWATSMALGDLAGDADRGRAMMPLPPATETVDGDLCFTFPWSDIIDSANADMILNCTGPGGDCQPPGGYYPFDYAAAQNLANLKYQVTAWYDPAPWTLPGAPDDYIESEAQGEPADCDNIIDVVPNVGMASATVIVADKEPKPEDINNDGAVSVFDLIKLKNQYNKTGLVKSCN